MDFLAKNYDKLILAFCLIILVIGITFVAMSFKTTNDLLAQQNRDVDNKMHGGEKIEELQAEEYSASHYLNDPRKFLNILGTPKKPTVKGSLIEPNKYIVCKNEECDYLISLNSSKCPFCGTEQPELAKELVGQEDTDNDGIPDKFELQYVSKGILNPRNPNDAKMDFDRDGFLNIEEYRLGTKLDDPEDFPPLGNLLRVVKVERRDLPIKLADIDQNRKDDPKDWDIVFTVPDPKTRKTKRMTRSIGDKVAGYVVTAAGFTGSGDAQTPYAEIALENAPSETYRLEKDKTVKSKKLTVRLLYLFNRERNNAQYVMNRFSFVKEVGEEFKLERAKTTSKVIEYYKLISADEKDGSATVALLKGEKGAVDKNIPLNVFKYAEDFVSYDMMGMGGGMGPGMGGEVGGPMIGPGPDAGRRQNRRQNREMR